MKIRLVILAKCLCLLALLAFPLGVAFAGTIAVVSSTAYVAAVPPATPGGVLTPLYSYADGTSGVAFDAVGGKMYIGGNYGSTINNRAVSGATGSLLDMTFANGFIYAAESNGTDSAVLDKIDPATMSVVTQFGLGDETIGTGISSPSSNTIPFMSGGVTWDGEGFWISDNPISSAAIADGIVGTSVRYYTFGEGGTALVPGVTFTPWADSWSLGAPSGGRTPGGLLWDSATGMLLVGTDNGEIWSVNTDEFTMSLYATSPDGGFVQGLSTVVPEPSSFLLLGAALAGCLALSRRGRQS